MKLLSRLLMAAFVLSFLTNSVDLSPASADAALSSNYTMFGAVTDLWHFDVDYYAPPINLHRVRNTFGVHEVRFEILRYESQCYQWEQVCTQYNQQGQCVRWENRCVQWGYRTYPVEKRVQLDFRALAQVPEGEEEVYELTVQRHRPNGDGEDWVYTWFRPVTTKGPVKIQRFGEFSYRVVPE